MKLSNAILLSTILFYSCSSNSKIISSWKATSNLRDYKKIMVVGIIKDSSTALRKKMETHLVNDFRSVGYDAVSALEEFGVGGLAGLEQEETYIKLCNKGIDAVNSVRIHHQKSQ